MEISAQPLLALYLKRGCDCSKVSLMLKEEFDYQKERCKSRLKFVLFSDNSSIKEIIFVTNGTIDLKKVNIFLLIIILKLLTKYSLRVHCVIEIKYNYIT